MNNESSLTTELLNADSSRKLDYFKTQVIVPHKNLKQISNQLLSKILAPDDALVYFVFGVTGIGKTTLRKRLQKVLMETFFEKLRCNPGKIAVSGIEVPSPEGGKFSHRDYYERVLHSLNEVLIEYKIIYEIHDKVINNFEPKSDRSRNARALRRAVENVFKYRQIEAFMVDEGQHIFATSGAQQMLEQMNWIKSIANLTETVHILFGTYDLLNCPNLTGQIGRRSEDFHFAPYYKENKEDYTEFKKVALTFARYMPLVKVPNFENKIDYFIDYSVGSVGIFHGWLYRSLRNCMDEHCNTLTFKHIKQGELAPYKRKIIREELENGNRVFAQLMNDNDNLNESNTQGERQEHFRKRTVGQRCPKRDPVGEN
jgi:AAA domain